MMHKRKVFGGGVVCLTGRTITFYTSDGDAIRRSVYRDAASAEAEFDIWCGAFG